MPTAIVGVLTPETGRALGVAVAVVVVLVGATATVPVTVVKPSAAPVSVPPDGFAEISFE